MSRILRNLLSSGHNFGPEERLLAFRFSFFNSSISICGAGLFAFALMRFWNNNALIGLIDLGYSLVTAIAVIALRRDKDYFQPVSTGVIVIAFVALAVAAISGKESNILLPYTLFIVMAFIVGGDMLGLLAYVVSCVSILLAGSLFPEIYLLRIILPLLAVNSIITYMIYSYDRRVRFDHAYLLSVNESLEERVSARTTDLIIEQARTKELLHNILPAELATELALTGATKARSHSSATILFADFAGFTQIASVMPADQMVAELNEIFCAFDDICDEFGVEKIKTIGDAYMAAAGIPENCANHASRAVHAGLRMVAFIFRRNSTSSFKWPLRVGIHTGPVVTGVVGKRKYAYDVWGDTVNIASRLETASEPGRVNISAYTYHLVRDEFPCEYRGRINVKGKGEMDMYFVCQDSESKPTT